MMFSKEMVWRIVLLVGLALPGDITRAQEARGVASGAASATNGPKGHQALAKPASTNSTVAGGHAPISFDTLAAFQVKVDWLVNPTNSSFDTLKLEGKIPDDIKSLNGKKVALQGYMKPLKQDGLVTEFLLMRNHSNCCDGKPLQINEWVHVQMAGKGVPYLHERLLTVQGALQVGELLGSGNVVSIYRIRGEEVIGPVDTR